jgi:Protein of unknown function (DUF2834).
MSNATYLQRQLPTSKKFLSTQSLYLLLTIIGAIAPWSFLLKFFLQNGLDLDLFFQNAFANHVASAVAIDLLICADVFFCFSFIELKRLGLSRRWLFVYVVATFGIGLSCALPLFLYWRERSLETMQFENQGDCAKTGNS